MVRNIRSWRWSLREWTEITVKLLKIRLPKAIENPAGREWNDCINKEMKQTQWGPSLLPSSKPLLLLVAPTFPQTPSTSMSFPPVTQLPAPGSIVHFGDQFLPFHHHPFFSSHPFSLTEITYRNPEFVFAPSHPTYLPIFHVTIRFILLKYNFDYVTLCKKPFSLKEAFWLVNHESMMGYIFKIYPGACAPQQEKAQQWEVHAPQLESRPSSPQLEQSLPGNEDPAQPIRK